MKHDMLEALQAELETVQRTCEQMQQSIFDMEEIVAKRNAEIERLKELLENERHGQYSHAAFEAAKAEIRRLQSKERILTCVYCGEAYPPGTPTSGVPALTAHIQGCQKHPLYTVLRQLEEAKTLLQRWVDDFENIDKGALCQTYDNTEEFLMKTEKDRE